MSTDTVGRAASSVSSSLAAAAARACSPGSCSAVAATASPGWPGRRTSGRPWWSSCLARTRSATRTCGRTSSSRSRAHEGVRRTRVSSGSGGRSWRPRCRTWCWSTSRAPRWTPCGRRVLTVPDVVLLGLQLAGALRHLHRHRLVHLDVKPGNAVVRHGRAVLLDLGALTPDGRVYGRHDAPAPRRTCHPSCSTTESSRRPATSSPSGRPARAAREGPCAAGVDDLLGRMTSPHAADRPSDDEVLAVLHAELATVGSSLWPRGRIRPPRCRRSIRSPRAHLAIPGRRARRPRPHRRGDRQLRRGPSRPPARRRPGARDRRRVTG